MTCRDAAFVIIWNPAVNNALFRAQKSLIISISFAHKYMRAGQCPDESYSPLSLYRGNERENIQKRMYVERGVISKRMK